jgi:hypothetical protein
MTCKSDSDPSPQDPDGSSQGGPKRHFDTFETDFFQQGDEASAGVAVEGERFDDLDEATRSKRLAPSRQFMMSVVVGSACLAIIGCVALWRSGRGNASSAVATPASAPAAPAEPARAKPAPVVAAAQAEPALAPATAPAAPTAVEAPALPVLAPAQLAAAPAQPSAAAAEKAAPAANLPTQAMPDDDLKSRCQKAMRGKRSKEILAACADAFAADPSAATIAVELAKIEFDRGRNAQAFAWGKKAVAADPSIADAYVFIGGAEQNAGHGKAAREAYKRYLQLAPSGRYAADLRAIVGSL